MPTHLPHEAIQELLRNLVSMGMPIETVHFAEGMEMLDA
jgi:hypothetical protein